LLKEVSVVLVATLSLSLSLSLSRSRLAQKRGGGAEGTLARQMSTGGVASGEAKPVEPAPEEERDWSEMTPVCLAEAFSRLALEDLWRGAMACCRSWRDAARSRPGLFAALDLEPGFAESTPGAEAAAWWTPAFQRRVDAMLRSTATLAAGELREVRVRHCSDEGLAFAAERCVGSLICENCEIDASSLCRT
jgi:F-box/leucine-rich repeat protein 2/20